MTRPFAFTVALALMPCALPAQGASHLMGMHHSQESGFEQYLYPPELVMQHQRELGLTEQQRAAITDQVKALQSQVVDFQWQIHDQQRQLAELLAGNGAAEAEAVALIERVLDLERRVKTAHFTALLRIRNTLTKEQQDQLAELRRHREWAR